MSPVRPPGTWAPRLALSEVRISLIASIRPEMLDVPEERVAALKPPGGELVAGAAPAGALGGAEAGEKAPKLGGGAAGNSMAQHPLSSNDN